MDWTPLLGPAVVAAVISGLVSGIGIWISARTSRNIHTEKLTFDREQAERRTAAEIGLAERKVDADIALAGKKLAIDQTLARWKCQTELAEDVLADFYQARDIIDAARSPGSLGGEGHTRPKEPWETERDSSRLDAYFRTTERLSSNEEFFSRLMARRHRFAVLFGPEAATPFLDLQRIRVDIVVAVRMLITTHRDLDQGPLQNTHQQWEAVIGWRPGPEDTIPARVEGVIRAIEEICQPTIRSGGQ